MVMARTHYLMIKVCLSVGAFFCYWPLMDVGSWKYSKPSINGGGKNKCVYILGSKWDHECPEQHDKGCCQKMFLWLSRNRKYGDSQVTAHTWTFPEKFTNLSSSNSSDKDYVRRQIRGLYLEEIQAVNLFQNILVWGTLPVYIQPFGHTYILLKKQVW